VRCHDRLGISTQWFSTYLFDLQSDSEKPIEHACTISYHLLGGIPPRIDFANIFAKLFLANKIKSFFWQMALCKWQIDFTNFSSQIRLKFCW